MNRVAAFVTAVVLLSSVSFAQHAADETKVWSLEHSYWQYVQANDLEHYRTLWNADFIGWPFNSPEPVRKVHITDWIAAHTSKGETFKTEKLEPLMIQVSDNLATTTYRLRGAWFDKSGVGRPTTVRIIHTWQRQPDGTWQIISGMSAPTDAQGH